MADVSSRLRILIISPHCDDAVFAYGSLLQTYRGSTVVTVCAGGPDPNDSLTEWDRSSGFQASDDVMALRRREDARALSLLGAYALWLPFYDSQYQTPASCSDVVRTLSVVIETLSPNSLFVPLGLFHSDHRLTSEACLTLRDGIPDSLGTSMKMPCTAVFRIFCTNVLPISDHEASVSDGLIWASWGANVNGPPSMERHAQVAVVTVAARHRAAPASPDSQRLVDRMDAEALCLRVAGNQASVGTIEDGPRRSKRLS